MRKVGLEPTRLAAQEPKSSASAISPLPRALKSLAHDVDNFSPVSKSGAKVVLERGQDDTDSGGSRKGKAVVGRR